MSRVKKLTDKERKENQEKSRNNWNKNNKEKSYRYQKKSRAKSFIEKDATREELNYFQKLITERLKELKSTNDNQ